MPIALRLAPRAPALRSLAAREDADAFAALYERHQAALHRYLRSILRDDEDARDALQSTMAKALAALRDEKRDFELRPWLFRIAHNEAISRLRQRRPTVSLDAAQTLGTDSLARAIEDRERLALLQADLQSLPERQRGALVMRELSGLSHEEIAAVLDSSPGAVKQAIFEARVALQDCAEGREMLCVEVQRRLSDGDGRVLRARKLRAHVRSCASCRTFKAALAQRPADLAALAPALPAAGALAGAGFAGGGAAAGLATKAAIVVVATATIAGAGTGVRDVVAPADGDTAPAKVMPSARHARTLPSPALAAPGVVRHTAAVAPQRGRVHAPAPARRAHHPAPAASRPPAHAQAQQPASAAAAPPPGQAQEPAAATSPPPGQATRAADGKPVPPGQAKKAASSPSPSPADPKPQPPGQASRTAAGKPLPPGQAKKAAPQPPPAEQPQAPAVDAAQAPAADPSLPAGQAKKQAAATNP